MIYLYAYDIADNRRRRGVYTKLGQFGIPIQKSVFQCDISAEMAETLKNALVRLMDEQEDHLYIVPLGAKGVEKAVWFGLPIPGYAEGSYSIL
jgi:CRISPR-associated protein Cas2